MSMGALTETDEMFATAKRRAAEDAESQAEFDMLERRAVVLRHNRKCS